MEHTNNGQHLVGQHLEEETIPLSISSDNTETNDVQLVNGLNYYEKRALILEKLPGKSDAMENGPPAIICCNGIPNGEAQDSEETPPPSINSDSTETGDIQLVNGHNYREKRFPVLEKLPGKSEAVEDGPSAVICCNGMPNGKTQESDETPPPSGSSDSTEIGDIQLVNGHNYHENKSPVLEKLSAKRDAVEYGPSAVIYCNDIPTGEILDSSPGLYRSVDEWFEGENPADSNLEVDDSKKDGDTSKAVTFAEDIEVFDLSRKASSPITVSLHTPVHCIDQHSSSVFSGQKEEPEDDVNSLSVKSKDLDTTDQGVINMVEECPTEEQIKSDKKSTAPVRPTLLNLAKKSDGSEIYESAKIPEEQALLLTEMPDKDIDAGKDLKAAQADDSAGHKEFTVLSVDEAEFARGLETDNAKMTSKESPVSDVVPLYERTLSPHSADGVSHSTDSNNQDTIGPLENPAFLKTLQYSVSQPFDQDEHFGIQSTLDLRSLTALQEPPDLDKGWAWVVLVAAFIASLLLGATVYATGVLVSAILQEINPDLTKVSWIGSINVCAMSLAGPFVGTPLKRFGARMTVSCAGVVVTLGYIGASFSTSVTHLILTHGLIAGIGAGFIINPIFVSVGQYFNKYRGLACGLLACGAGAGMLTGGATFSFLLSMYGLSGTYLIWSGVLFHITPIGMLLRPSPEERLRTMELTVEEFQQGFSSQPDLNSIHNSSGLNSLFGSVNQSMLSGMDKIGHGRRSAGSKYLRKISNGEPDTPLLKAVLHQEMSRSSHSVATNRSHPRSHITSPVQHSKYGPGQGHGDLQMTSIPPSPTHSPSATSPITVPSLSQHTLSNNLASSPHHGNNAHLQSTITLTPANTTPNYPPSSPTSIRGPLTQSRSQRIRLMSTGSQSQYTSTSHISRRLSFRGSLQQSSTGDLDNESITSTLVSQLRPRDALEPRHPLGSRSFSTLMGSIASFPTALAIVRDDLSRYEAFSTVGPTEKSLKGFGIKVLDSLRLLRNKPFLIFLCSSFLWSFGESPVMIYLPSYAISRGTSPMQASSLYTPMGVGSILGRFLSGLVATDGSVGPVILHAGCQGIAGVLVAMSPLMTATVVQQMIFAFFVGIYTGSLVPLASLITMEMLGIDELGLGFGFFSMAQGMGYLIGPPLASIIVRAIGYEHAFVFAGFVLLAGSVVGMTTALTLKRSQGEDDDEQEQPSLHDLEKALQRIADIDSEEEEGDDVPGDKQLEEESVKNLGGSVGTPSDAREYQKSSPADGNILAEGSGELVHHSQGGEEKLDTIMEVVGK